MSKTKIDCEQAVCLSQELFHAHFAGEPEKWFSYLSPDSIYLGTGEPALFGQDIQENSGKILETGPDGVSAE